MLEHNLFSILLSTFLMVFNLPIFQQISIEKKFKIYYWKIENMLEHVVNNQFLIFISLFILMNKKFYLNVIFLINSIHHIFFLFLYNLYDDERLWWYSSVSFFLFVLCYANCGFPWSEISNEKLKKWKQ